MSIHISPSCKLALPSLVEGSEVDLITLGVLVVKLLTEAWAAAAAEFTVAIVVCRLAVVEPKVIGIVVFNVEKPGRALSSSERLCITAPTSVAVVADTPSVAL